jgi:uncharacterized protein HemY
MSGGNFGVTSQRFSLIKIATMKALAVSCCLFLLPILAFGQGERVNDLGKRAKLLLDHGQWEAAHRLLGEKLQKKRFRKSAALWLLNARACRMALRSDMENNRLDTWQDWWQQGLDSFGHIGKGKLRDELAHELQQWPPIFDALGSMFYKQKMYEHCYENARAALACAQRIKGISSNYAVDNRLQLALAYAAQLTGRNRLL